MVKTSGMKRLITPVTAALAASLLASCGLEPEEMFSRAQQSYAAHDFASSRLDLVSALKERPDDKAMLELLARVQIELGDGVGAIATLDKLAAAGGSPADASMLRAEAEVLRGRFEKGLAIVEDMQTAEAYRIAALAHIGLKEPQEALKALEAGEKAEGPKAGLLAAFARFRLAQRQIVVARDLADRARKADPALLEPMLVSGEIAVASNRMKDALAIYEEAHSKYPDSFAALIGRIGALGDLDRLDEAEDLLAQAAKTHAGNPRVVFLQARMAVEKEEWDDARSLLQSNEHLVRNTPAMQALYAESLLNLGQVEQSRVILQGLVTKFPGMRQPRKLLADAQMRGGDSQAALETIRPLAERPDASPEELDLASKAASKTGDAAASRYANRAKLPEPEWVGGELAKADAAMRNGKWRDAVASYEELVRRSEQPNAMVLNNLAYAKARLGDTDAATALALKAVALAPDHPAILDTAGWLLVESGKDKEKGITLLAKANKLDPENTGIAKRLADARKL